MMTRTNKEKFLYISSHTVTCSARSPLDRLSPSNANAFLFDSLMMCYLLTCQLLAERLQVKLDSKRSLQKSCKETCVYQRIETTSVELGFLIEMVKSVPCLF